MAYAVRTNKGGPTARPTANTISEPSPATRVPPDEPSGFASIGNAGPASDPTGTPGMGQTSGLAGARAGDQPGFQALANPATMALNAMGFNPSALTSSILGQAIDLGLNLAPNAVPGLGALNMARSGITTLGRTGDMISNLAFGRPSEATFGIFGDQGPFTQGQLSAAGNLGITSPSNQGFQSSLSPTGFVDIAGRTLGTRLSQDLPENMPQLAQQGRLETGKDPDPTGANPGPPGETVTAPTGVFGNVSPTGPVSSDSPAPAGTAPSSDTPGGQAGNADTGGAAAGSATGGGTDAAEAHRGGIVTGPPGAEGNVKVQSGETIMPRGPMADLAAQMLIGKSPIRNYLNPRDAMMGGGGMGMAGQPNQQGWQSPSGGMQSDPVSSGSMPRGPATEPEQLQNGSKSQQEMQKLKEILIRFAK